MQMETFWVIVTTCGITTLLQFLLSFEAKKQLRKKIKDQDELNSKLLEQLKKAISHLENSNEYVSIATTISSKLLDELKRQSPS
jgi:restriction endonuclease S subunit